MSRGNNSIEENNIQELKMKLRELSEYKEKMDSIFLPLNALIFIVDHDGTYLHISPTCPDELLIMPREEMEGKKIPEIFPEGQARFFMNVVEKALKERKTIITEYQLPIKGRNFWFESRCSPIANGSDNPTKVISFIRDISDWRLDKIKKNSE
jgi:PAS domain S-box-containing protein